jgi:hypothetical protein
MMTSQAMDHQDHNKWLQWKQEIEPKFKSCTKPEWKLEWSALHYKPGVLYGSGVAGLVFRR